MKHIPGSLCVSSMIEGQILVLSFIEEIEFPRAS